ncbi:MAG: hypothetical protein ACKOAC_07890 [Fluviibacter sp.]
MKLIPLMLERAGQLILCPANDLPLHNGDKIIWAGSRDAWNEQKLTGNNTNALSYIMTGHAVTGSWLGKYLNT